MSFTPSSPAWSSAPSSPAGSPVPSSPAWSPAPEEEDDEDERYKNVPYSTVESASYGESRNNKPLPLHLPQFLVLGEEDGILRFRLSHLNVSLANAIRRTLLHDIPVYVLDTEQKCEIPVNTTRPRIHNEMIKHRLSCVPVHQPVTTDIADTMEDYVAEINKENDTGEMQTISTEDIRIFDRKTQSYVSENVVRRMFPKCDISQSYILLGRLRPKINDLIPGEKMQITCGFSVRSAADSSAFTAVSTCAYMNTLDTNRIAEVWQNTQTKLEAEGANAKTIAFQKRNFELLDAQRYFLPDSFDFVLESVGIYKNMELVFMACSILKQRFQRLGNALREGDAYMSLILPAKTTIERCHDFILEEGDYTLGPVLEFFIYHHHFLGYRDVQFCGFKKFHPHDSSSVIRIALAQESRDKSSERSGDAAFGKSSKQDVHIILDILLEACDLAATFYQNVLLSFSPQETVAE